MEVRKGVLFYFFVKITTNNGPIIIYSQTKQNKNKKQLYSILSGWKKKPHNERG